MRRLPGRMLCVAVLVALVTASVAHADDTMLQLDQGVTAFINNPDGVDFTLSVDVRDCNYQSESPSEMLLKVYGPDGRPVVREVVPDDGIDAPAYVPPVAGWDHQAWYYATCYSRGIEPTVRWSAWSDPARLADMKFRTLNYRIAGKGPGVYRVVMVGNNDLFVTVRTDAGLKFGVSGSPEWIRGHGRQYSKCYVYVPQGVAVVHGLLMQNDRPKDRTFTVSDAGGRILMTGSSMEGLARKSYRVAAEGELDGQILTVEVSEGTGDFLLNVTLEMAAFSGGADTRVNLDNFDRFRPRRAPQAVAAVLCDDPETARAIQNGAIFHDGHQFWQMYQVRLYDWLKSLKPEQLAYEDSEQRPQGFISVGSHESPRYQFGDWGDIIMHRYVNSETKNPVELNAGIEKTFYGMRLIGPGDHVAIGPLRNLAYENGCYAYFYPRQAWRIIQQSDAPKEVKDIMREFVIQVGDRLCFARGMERVNGNAFASMLAQIRYCAAAADDEMLNGMFGTFFERFTTGGFGERTGQGPSGGIQESFGYDFHYGTYVLSGWRAVNQDIQDPRILAAYDRVLEMYSYMWSPVGAAPQNSRTSNRGARFDAWNPRFPWKGHGGPDFTVSVLGANEWFAARRPNYYVTTYHGRLTPTWMGEGFQGQIGFGGGAICQVAVPGDKNGTVIGSKVNHSYGGGMHLSQWRNFHIHSIVGMAANGKPLVAANSEHFNARLNGRTVTSSAEVRESSVTCERTYTFEADVIRCGVKLGPSASDNAFAIWGGRPKLRGVLTECYEMIPFEDAPINEKTGKRGANPTVLKAIAADGSDIGVVTDQPVEAAAVLISRPGCGVRIDLDQPRPVLRGQNDTLLIQLANQPTPAEQIALSYVIVPYRGEPPVGLEGVEPPEPNYLPELGAIQDVGDVAAALDQVEPMVVTDPRKKPVAEFRVGASGQNLALHARVVEPELVRGNRIWNGTDIEVFGAMPTDAKIGQVFLLPEAGGKPAAAFRAEGGKQIPTREIAVASVVTDTGYDLVALIPMKYLAVDLAAEHFLLEFQFSTADPGGKPPRQYNTMFKSKLAYMNSLRYGRFAVGEPDPDKEE